MAHQDHPHRFDAASPLNDSRFLIAELSAGHGTSWNAAKRSPRTDAIDMALVAPTRWPRQLRTAIIIGSSAILWLGIFSAIAL